MRSGTGIGVAAVVAAGCSVLVGACDRATSPTQRPQPHVAPRAASTAVAASSPRRKSAEAAPADVLDPVVVDDAATTSDPRPDLSLQLGPLESMTEHDASSRSHIREIVRELGTSPRSVEHLFNLIRREAQAGHRVAAEACIVAAGQIASRDAEERLLALLDDPQFAGLAPVVAHALAQNRWGTTVPAGTWTMSTLLVDLSVPIAPGPLRERLVQLAAGSTPDEALRRAAVEALAHSTGPDVADALVAAAGSPAASTREAAYASLGIQSDERSLATLSGAAARDPSRSARRVATFHLIRRADLRTLDQVEEWVGDGSTDEHRLEAVALGLSSLAGRETSVAERACAMLCRMLRDSTSSRVRATAAAGLQPFVASDRDANAATGPAAAVLAVVRDETADELVRLAAIRSLTPPPARRGVAAEALEGVVRGRGPRNVRLEAIRQLGRIVTVGAGHSAEVAAAVERLRPGIGDPEMDRMLTELSRTLVAGAAGTSR